MKTVWLVSVDRYGDESRAKSEDGRIFSVVQTADLLIEEYKACKTKPEIEVVACGLGQALSDYLKDRWIPHVIIRATIARIGSADIIKYRRNFP